jgi:hypothetical protein
MPQTAPLSPPEISIPRYLRSAWLVATLTWSLAWHGPLRQH